MGKKIVVAQGLCVQKYFYKEMIEDGVQFCRMRGAHPKSVILWYKINLETEIKVETKQGLTYLENNSKISAQTNQNVKQSLRNQYVVVVKLLAVSGLTAQISNVCFTVKQITAYAYFDRI